MNGGADVCLYSSNDNARYADFVAPAIYKLLKDPQEQERLRHYIEDTGIEVPSYRVLEEQEASIGQDPSTPDPWDTGKQVIARFCFGHTGRQETSWNGEKEQRIQ